MKKLSEVVSDVGTDSEDDRIDRKICGYFVHPAADEFPMFKSSEFEELTESIRKTGQLVPVTVLGDTILEGRHRATVVESLRAGGLDIELRTVPWEPTEACPTPAQFITNVNLARRNLTPDQRAMIATALISHIERELAERRNSSRIRPGEQRNPTGLNQHAKSGPADATAADPVSDPPSTREKNREKRAASLRGKIAAEADVSFYKGDLATYVARHGSSQQVKAVKEGKKKLSAVVREIDEKMGLGSGAAGTPAKKRRPIEHPFKPADDFEYDCLAAWISFVEKSCGVGNKDRARRVFMEIFRVEVLPKVGSRKKSEPEAPAEAEAVLSHEDLAPETESEAVSDQFPKDGPAVEAASPPEEGRGRPRRKSKKSQPATVGLINPANLWNKTFSEAFRRSDD